MFGSRMLAEITACLGCAVRSSSDQDEHRFFKLFFSTQVLVPGNIHSAFLDNLIPDTPYSVDVQALYADGEGSSVSGDGKTRKSLDSWTSSSHRQ